MTGFVQDLHFGLRQLRKSLGFTSVAVITLGLGIGANTAIFSLLDAVLLRKLAVEEPKQLVLFGKGTWRGSMDELPNRSWQLFSYPFLRNFRQKTQSFFVAAGVSRIFFATHGGFPDGSNLKKINV